MPVQAEQSHPVIDHDGISVNSEGTGKNNHSVIGRFNGRMDGRSKVNAQMNGIAKGLTIIHIGPLISEQGHGSGVVHPCEGSFPHLFVDRFSAEFLNGFIILLPQGRVYMCEDFFRSFSLQFGYR